MNPFLEALLRLRQALLHFRPQRLGHVHPGAGRALLTLVLEGAPRARRHDRVDVRRRVDEVVVLAAALADQLGEAGVVVKVLAHGLPQPLKGAEICQPLDSVCSITTK